MKKAYVTPKVELLDFDYTDTVVASGPATTDVSTQWWTCNTYFVEVKNIEGTVCGANPNAG